MIHEDPDGDPLELAGDDPPRLRITGFTFLYHVAPRDSMRDALRPPKTRHQGDTQGLNPRPRPWPSLFRQRQLRVEGIHDDLVERFVMLDQFWLDKGLFLSGWESRAC